MKCLYCGKIFNLSKKFALHVEYFHKKTNYFVCPFEQCSRIYHRKTDFQKHVDNKHLKNSTKTAHSSKNSSQNINETDSNLEICDFKEVLSSSKENQNLPSENSPGYFLNDNESAEKAKRLFCSFKVMFSEGLVTLMSNLYENLSLTRAAIQLIINSINSLLSHDIFEYIKKILDIMTHDKNVEKPKKILISMLNMLETPFCSLDTEYKREKFFDSTDALVRPVEHRLGVCQESQKKIGKMQ